MGRFLGPESIRVRTEVGFEDRLDDEFHRHLRYPVTNCRYPQRPQTAVRFGYPDAPHRLGSVSFVFQVLGQFPHKRFYPLSTLYGFKADPIHAGTASVGTDKMPSVSEYLCPADLVVERVKAIGRFLLGLGIQLPL